jgi:TonB family protein
MSRKPLAWTLVALGCSSCATPYLPPTVEPPPLWSGQSGWQFDAASVRVNEGVKKPGEIIVEHETRLIRTGIVKEAIRMRNEFGTPLIIPEGAKAFATNFTLVTGVSQVRQKIDPIEWCVFLPQGINGSGGGAETVCIFWESEQQARYSQDFQVGGFSFLPSMDSPAGMPGVVPKIEEQPVDFGRQFKRQILISKITEKDVTLQFVYSDETNSKLLREGTLNWNADGTLAYEVGETTLMLTRAPDSKSVDVKSRALDPTQYVERTVLLELLVGADGRVKEARIMQSSGSPSLDATALKQAKQKLKIQPATDGGQPVDRWTPFEMKFRLLQDQDASSQPATGTSAH